MLSFLTFCFFIIPLLCFNGRAFDIHEFWRQLMSLMLVVCVFYIIDVFVVRGWLLVPCAWFSFDNVSTWHSIVMYGPGGPIPRKYPPGIFPLALLVYPLARYYRLRWWQWGIVLVALGSTQTSTVIFALVIGYIICQGTVKKYLLYGVGAISLFTLLYYIDDSMGYTTTDQSTMRIASSVNQILALDEAEDDEDLPMPARDVSPRLCHPSRCSMNSTGNFRGLDSSTRARPTHALWYSASLSATPRCR